jgi:hypothetical protein
MKLRFTHILKLENLQTTIHPFTTATFCFEARTVKAVSNEVLDVMALGSKI